ncbi:hypothetical protein GF322_02980 [Candidatus Dependentiae bacterium]|nr:hypothetical protein [Candidatus Dependentiae bacterium]
MIVCGKHEHEVSMGTAGAISGAAVGCALCNEKNKRKGLVFGGLIGNYLGQSVGREIDDNEDKQKNVSVNNNTENLSEVLSEKWCVFCKQKIDVVNARNCPFCGKQLMYKKFCRKCNTFFKPYKSCKCKTSFSSVVKTCLSGIAEGLGNALKNKICINCNRKIDLVGAKNCPYCGCKVKTYFYNPTQKYCSVCRTSFPIESEYKYCPYCYHRNYLKFR